MNIRTTVAILTLSTLPMSVAATTDRQSQAIERCIEKAHENYEVKQDGARFWQMNQVGRYIRVWLKVRTSDDENIKTLCKVHKNGSGVTEMKRLGS